ncbi:hypothetical protein SUGI_1365370 [Cryptomeria japonica]|uniref:Uncharacterized protein n=1 Tax=Cryptomeria japonica TaxID=3369 RepID=A0AAD3NR44_CRYJA|nr:hypothetical protein SUGI_1365370 [Cryptomeria japonica]
MSGSQLVGVCAWGRVPSGRDYASGATRDQEWISWLEKSCTGSALVVRVERSRQGWHLRPVKGGRSCEEQCGVGSCQGRIRGEIDGAVRSDGGKPVRGQVTKEVKGKSTEGAGRSVDSASVRQSGTMDGSEFTECVGCNARVGCLQGSAPKM